MLPHFGQGWTNFYPRPPRGGRRGGCALHGIANDISIHALREEGDDKVLEIIHKYIKFLSTPSARRATVTFCLMVISTSNFYPRPPRGGRLRCCCGSWLP